MSVNLRGYKGKVRKGASVYSDDPKRPQLRLTLTGEVKQVIEVRPKAVISFNGMAAKLKPQTVDIVTVTTPFKITKLESTVEDKIAYQLKTVEAGKHYQLIVRNKIPKGIYYGYLVCKTDHPKKPAIRIRIRGTIEGKVTVRPRQLLVGITARNSSVRNGLIMVVNNLETPFKITKLGYDKSLMKIKTVKMTDRSGYSLKVIPKLDTIPKGQHKETKITITTDVPGAASSSIKVYVLHQ